MWNESATSASECTAYPTISSSRKKHESMASRIMMRVDLESAMAAVLERVRSCGSRCAGSIKGALISRRRRKKCEEKE